MKYLFDGLPPKVITYIKIHLRYIYSTGLFSHQEREDLIQDLVLFYLEFIRERGDVPDDTLFMALKSKAMHLGRTRLREMQSGSLNIESLNDMSETLGYVPEDSFCLGDLENTISLRELMSLLSEKEQLFVSLLLRGETTRAAKRLAKVSNNVIANIRRKLKK